MELGIDSFQATDKFPPAVVYTIIICVGDRWLIKHHGIRITQALRYDLPDTTRGHFVRAIQEELPWATLQTGDQQPVVEPSNVRPQFKRQA